jgi:acetyl-CoA carboxylase carboxyl transferase subunit beta
VIGVQDFAFMGGSMGQAVGEAFISGVEAAIAAKAPYVVFTASGGARMQEGILSLMQMPRTTVAIEMLHDAGLPYIVVLTDPDLGRRDGRLCDAGRRPDRRAGATFGLHRPPRDREHHPREAARRFPDLEYYRDHGLVDMVTHRKELRETLVLGRLIGLLS